jgi:glycosyltransferase involved in cell wall biosynthesis
LTIDYYAHAANLKRTPEILAIGDGIRVKVLESSKQRSLIERSFVKLGNLFKIESLFEDRITREIEQRVKEYDLAYFPSAHMMPYPSLNVPVTGTIHDFNWKYFFGRQIFSKDFVDLMDIEIVKWISKSKTISSSWDVITEAKKLYPGLVEYPEVVHLAPVAFSKTIEDDVADKTLKEIGIDYPYIIFPGNFFPHKNHLNLFTAFSLLRKRKGFEKLKLVLTGMNTDQVSFGIAEERGIQLVNNNGSDSFYDVRGLGYQPNHVIEALIKRAILLVSPSIYEAICTPAMDAWHFGTPTAISDIPPFREHESVWNIRSAFFNPMDPSNIADVVGDCLTNYDIAKKNAIISKENIAKYTWDKVAKGYLKTFNSIIG